MTEIIISDDSSDAINLDEDQSDTITINAVLSNYIDAGGGERDTLTNNGTIDFQATHANSSAAFYSDASFVDVTNAGSISALVYPDPEGEPEWSRGNGVQVSTGTLTLTNLSSGEIKSGKHGVYVSGDGITASADTDITNQGLIQSIGYSVLIYGGTVTNSGTLKATGGAALAGDPIYFSTGIYSGYLSAQDSPGFQTEHTSITNTASGSIYGQHTGIYLKHGGGSVTNAGSVSGGTIGVRLKGSNLTLDLTSSGTISTDGSESATFYDQPAYGILVDRQSSLDLTLSGTVSSSDTGIYAGQADITVSSNGSILANTAAGNSGFAIDTADEEDFTAYANRVYTSNQSTQMLPDDFWSYAPNAQLEAYVVRLGLIDGTDSNYAFYFHYEYEKGESGYYASTGVLQSYENEFGIFTLELVNGGYALHLNGELVTEIPDDFSFADTITNAGFIDGNISLGLGDDTLTNTGEIGGRVYLGDGADVFVSTSDGANVFGGSGHDSITGSSEADILRGDAGADTINGGAGNDQIWAGSGDVGGDRFFGGDGADILGGGGGNDLLVGGNGADALFGGNGQDTLVGGLWNGGTVIAGTNTEQLWAGGGNDMLYGSDVADQLGGGIGDDTVYGNGGADTIYAGKGGDDVLFGGSGRDIVFAGSDNDQIDGGDGNDELYGGTGDDAVTGGSGADTLYGGSGADTLDGGIGADILRPGAGTDLLIFQSGHGADTVEGFDLSEDILDLSDLSVDFSDLDGVRDAATELSDGILIDTGGGDSIFLTSVSLSDIDSLQVAF
ncbi:calcium-binding protein [Kordiimonas lacus]|uniref:Ca2+-binding protein, RTX toxin-related n=1 Tax=Kordiimonas lacus TaxID=637679 RepID=A0A1G7EH44_9PROT|nr:calcium-binding protein [Kordiimonas lacus]SDE62982.1 Ca2+-binding protein, RTX toxin-related [Kordiimonas lacus]